MPQQHQNDNSRRGSGSAAPSRAAASSGRGSGDPSSSGPPRSASLARGSWQQRESSRRGSGSAAPASRAVAPSSMRGPGDYSSSGSPRSAAWRLYQERLHASASSGIDARPQQFDRPRIPRTPPGGGSKYDWIESDPQPAPEARSAAADPASSPAGQGASGGRASVRASGLAARAEEYRDQWHRTRGRSVRASALPPEARVITYGQRISRFLSRYRWYNPQGLDGWGETHGGNKDGQGPSQDDGRVENAFRDDEAPQSQQQPKPSLERAWDFYEHVTLPRYLVGTAGGDVDPDDDDDDAGEEKKTRKGRNKAKERCNGREEEECASALYNFWTTRERDISVFGIGVVLYFWLLRVMAVLMVIAGLIGLPNMLYFASTSYSALGQGGVRSFKTLLVGSAICTDEVWQACPGCADHIDTINAGGGKSGSFVNMHESTPDRFAVSTTDPSLTYILQNRCSIGFVQGMLMYAPMLFLLVSCFLVQFVASWWEGRMDKSVQTADDYTLQICNPPGDARDPDEWRDFFTQFIRDEDGGHITCCTVALDNRLLLQKLIRRRLVLRQLELTIEPGVAFDPQNLDAMVERSLPVPRWKRVLGLAPDAHKLREQIDALEKEILDHGKDEAPPVSDVYVTFETEHSMQRAFEALSIPKWMSRKGDISKAVESGNRCCRLCFKRLASEDLLFRGEHILYVVRPPDPTDIRWEDLSVKTFRIVLEQAFALLVFAAVTAAGCFLVIAAYRNNFFAAITISLLNFVIPTIVKAMISLFESHRTVGSLQVSLYAKVAIFRWVNTAIITLLVTPFTNTISLGQKYLIPKVYAIFFAELFTSPLMSIADIGGHFSRHILGPRQVDQWRMNLLFQGGYFTLAERQTAITKIVFLACWYSAIFPAAFFFAACALLINYTSDKFCLLRVWAPAPRLGTDLTRVNQTFFLLAMFLYAYRQAFAISGFPYDNACESNSTVSAEYVNDRSAVTGDGQLVTVSIEEGDSNYNYCFQDLHIDSDRSPLSKEFAIDGQEWMTEGQALATQIAGATAAALLACVGSVTFLRYNIEINRECCNGAYKPSKSVDDRFSDEKEIVGYVPQTSRFSGFFHPFLACDVSEIDPRLIGWTSDKPLDAHNLWCDFPTLRNCFSLIRHWPPVGESDNKSDA